MKRHLPQFHKIELILKVSLEEIPPTIFISIIQWKKLNLYLQNWIYTKGEETHFYKFFISHTHQKVEFMSKVSLEETLSTIPQNRIYIKGISWKKHLPQFSN